MRDDWRVFFDNLPEEEILKHLPQELPPMEEELAAKGIEKKVLQGLGEQKRSANKRNRKKSIAAVICCLAAIGALGHEPILAAFQRLFYDLPGVGVYIDEGNAKIYEVQMDEPVQEKDGVQVELKHFYYKNGILYGEFEFTGKCIATVQEEDNDKERAEAWEELKKRFEITYSYGGKTGKLYDRGSGGQIEDGKILRYTRRCELSLGKAIEKGYDTYEIAIKGFDRVITLKITEGKATANAEDLGYTVTQNDTALTARATLAQGEIRLECFVIPSSEVKPLREEFDYLYKEMPYHGDFENAFVIKNAAGERMEIKKSEKITNGGRYILEGGEEDFPLTLHRSPFTGTDRESQSITLPLPKEGETRTENLPQAKFHYGTVELLSVERTDEIWKDSNEYSDRTEEATKVTVEYRILPEKGQRQMYGVDLLPDEEGEGIECLESHQSGEEKEGIFRTKQEFILKRTDSEELELLLEHPVYWIEGEYDIVIEKPMRADLH